MKSINEIMPTLVKIIEGLGKQFGPNCEFVLHDYSKEFGSTIVGIANGNVTGRGVGNGGTEIGLKLIQGSTNDDGRFNYISQTQDGRYLRSSTMYLKDDEGNIIGTLCVNLDITKLVGVKNYLNEICTVAENDKKEKPVVFKNIEDMLIFMINESVQQVGTPVSMMSREQKIKGISYLYDRGAFKIKNSVNIVAKYYDVSKYTIYNYLNESIAPSK